VILVRQPHCTPILINFCNQQLGLRDRSQTHILLEVGSQIFFNILFYTWPALENIHFYFKRKRPTKNLVYWLEDSTHIDDNYVLRNLTLRKEWPKYFQTKKWRKLGGRHPNFLGSNDQFPKGLPRIMKNDGKRPQCALGNLRSKLSDMYFFTLLSDLGDGWGDPRSTIRSKEVRLMACKGGQYNLLRFWS